jgi:hypothetical protein
MKIEYFSVWFMNHSTVAISDNCTFGGMQKKIPIPANPVEAGLYFISNHFLSKVKPMSISSSHQDLFRQPSAAEKISLVRSLMDTGDLNADVATALLKSIHSELAQPQSQNHSLYASYARLMQSLQHEMPEVHQHVVATWQAARQAETEDISGIEEPAEVEIGGKVEPKSTEETRAEETAEPGESSNMEGEPEESESEPEAEKGQIEEEEQGEKEEREAEESEKDASEQDEEPEQEREEESEVNVEESEIEQEELETKEELGEEETDEEKEELEGQEIAGEEVKESEKPEGGEETDKAEDSESVEESDHMATEAAEAAAHLEHAESETDVAEEEPGEEEPPIEAAE